MNLIQKFRELLTPAWVAEFRATLALIRNKEDAVMIDTKKILDAVEKEITENAGLRTLVRSQQLVIKTQADALKKAQDDLAAAGVDVAALAQVQADLDAAADKLGLDDADTADALAANVPPAGGLTEVVKDTPA